MQLNFYSKALKNYTQATVLLIISHSMAALPLICPLRNDKSHVSKMNHKDSLIINQKTYQTYNSQH